MRYPPNLGNLNGVELHIVLHFNYLGVIIDSDLSFRAQCRKLRSMANSRFTQLCNLKRSIDEELSLTIYKSMVLPIFDYCDFVLDAGPVNSVRGLQTVQNRCLRLCLGILDPRDITTAALHTRCSLVKLFIRRRKHILSIMYNWTRDPEHTVQPTRVLRNNTLVKVKVARPILESFCDSPLYRGMLLWQELKAGVQHSGTIDIFKAQLQNIRLDIL